MQDIFEEVVCLKRRILKLFLAVLVIWGMTGCGQQEADGRTAMDAEAASDRSEHAKESAVDLTEGKYSDEKLDDAWEEEASVQIQLDEDKITVKASEPGNEADGADHNPGVDVSEMRAVITQAGTYILSGTLKDGQIVIDADKEELVRLVLNGAELNCSSSAPIYSKGGNVVIILAEGTENVVTDGTEYIYEEGEDEPKAAIFAKDDLTFNGTGTLSVTGNYKHGIQCKDDLKFITGTYEVKAAEDGIVGKDSITVRNGNFTIDSEDDGMKATNIEETDKGYVLIEDGSFQITAGGDGIQAETLLRVNDGNMEIATGGGSQNAAVRTEMPMGGGRAMTKGRMISPEGMEGDSASGGQPPEGMEDGFAGGGQPPKGAPPDGQDPGGEQQEGGIMSQDGQESNEERANGEQPSGETAPPDEPGADEESAAAFDSGKALKSYVELIIAGGEFDLDSCDDGIHSNQNVTISNGSFRISTGDDGIHADQTLTIEDGDIDIQQSYEGVEGFEVVIDGGNVKILASDDGINAAGEADEADSADDSADDGREAEKPDHGRGNPMAEEDQGATLTINGGTVYVNAGGDGLDANGDIFINGGDIAVHGPADGGNGTLDYASSCKITGGTFVGVGSAGMIQNPSEDSAQPVIVWKLDEPVEAGTVIAVKDKEGKVIVEKTTEKMVQWLAVSSPEFIEGETYTVCVGDRVKEVNLE